MTVSDAQIPVSTCPLCGHGKFAPAGRAANHVVVRCEHCGLHLLNPQPSDAKLVEIYHPNYSFFGAEAGAEACVSRVKQATADHYLDLLAANGVSSGDLLEVGCGDGDFLARAAQRNFRVEGIDYSAHSCRKAQAKIGPSARISQGEISLLAGGRDTYDVCVAADVIEHVRQPGVFLQTVFNLLRPNAWVLLVTPNMNSLTAKLMGSRWLEFKAEHMYYYTPYTLRRQLDQAGFTDIRILGGKKMLSLDYITRHFVTYPVPGVTGALRLVRAILPQAWNQHLWLIPAGGIVALARKSPAASSLQAHV